MFSKPFKLIFFWIYGYFDETFIKIYYVEFCWNLIIRLTWIKLNSLFYIEILLIARMYHTMSVLFNKVKVNDLLEWNKSFNKTLINSFEPRRLFCWFYCYQIKIMWGLGPTQSRLNNWRRLLNLTIFPAKSIVSYYTVSKPRPFKMWLFWSLKIKIG